MKEEEQSDQGGDSTDGTVYLASNFSGQVCITTG